jgi:uncharacterized protein (TIGR03083 family)
VEGTAGTQWTIPDAVLPVDDSGARASVRRVADRAVELVAEVGDVDIPVPGSDWTFRRATCHLITVLRAFGASMEGRLDGWGTPEGDVVARALMDVEDSGDARALARHLDDAAGAFVAASAGRAPGDVIATPWYGRDKNHLAGPMTCLVLGEVVFHGYDLAQALGRPWPIDPEDARRIVTGVFPAKAPVITDPEATRDVDLTYEVRVEGGPAFSFRFAGETGVIRPAGTWPPDCILEGDPDAVVLWVYGRVATEELFASGRLRASGPDPSLGPRFKQFLRNP